MNKIRLNNISLYPIILICVTFFTFSFTELIHGNGYLAVYVTGLVAGNGKMVHKRECQKFLEGITWFVQIIMFISLGLMVSPQKMAADALLALATGAFMIFVARPASVFICLAPFRQFNIKAKLLASWVGLRGATPIIFATYPLVAGVEGADQIFNVVFFITLISLMLQGTTIPFVARKLGLLTELPKEGNSFGIEFPEEIQNKLTDWEVHEGMLEHGNLIKHVELPANSLIIMIKRDKQYLMPKGDVALQVGDMLLLMEDASVSTTGAMSIQKALENIQDTAEKPEQQPEVADAAVPVAQPVHTK
ncbi:MAG: cation:proton antiporter [Bacteroidales bacterium]|nr:cation:proton antiporter [Bacteroidales bacterium]